MDGSVSLLVHTYALLEYLTTLLLAFHSWFIIRILALELGLELELKQKLKLHLN